MITYVGEHNLQVTIYRFSFIHDRHSTLEELNSENMDTSQYLISNTNFSGAPIIDAKHFCREVLSMQSKIQEN